nr:substrate binding domain-containing protein [Stutzerimonas nitrititolerans]
MAYYKVAAAVLDELGAASKLVRSQTLRPKGGLKVSVPTSFALMVLSPHLAPFLEAYPELRLELSLNDRFVDLAEEGFDCAIRIASHFKDSSLVAKPLGKVERLVVASPSYLTRHGTPASPRDLARHNCLLYSLSVTSDSWPLTEDGKSAPTLVAGRLRVNSFAGLCYRDVA